MGYQSVSRTHHAPQADHHTLVPRAGNPCSFRSPAGDVRVHSCGGYLVAGIRDSQGPDGKCTLPEGILRLAFLLYKKAKSMLEPLREAMREGCGFYFVGGLLSPDPVGWRSAVEALNDPWLRSGK